MVVHEGKLRLAGSERGVSSYRTASIAGVEVQVANRAAHFPIAARSAGFQDGDLIEVTAGENAGTVWRVVEADSADQKTALRLPVIAADRPVEWG